MAKKKNQEQEIVTNESVDKGTTDQVTNKPKRKIKPSTIVITSIVVTTAIAAGLATGILFGKLFSTGDVVLPPLEAGIEMDYDALMARYAEDNNPDSYLPHELANISWNLFAQKENTYSVGHGKAHAVIVDQYTYSYDVRRGNNWYSESVSSNKGTKVKQVAYKYYQDTENVRTYSGSGADLGPVRANWKEDSELVETLEQYENKWGRKLGRPCIFIISPATVQSETVERDSEDNYIIEMDMDIKNSVYRYKKQMIAMSNLTSAPIFKKLHLTFTLDKDLNLQKLRSDESYEVKVVGTNKTDGFFETKYYHDCADNIPEIQSTYGNYEEL